MEMVEVLHLLSVAPVSEDYDTCDRSDARPPVGRDILGAPPGIVYERSDLVGGQSRVYGRQ